MLGFNYLSTTATLADTLFPADPDSGAPSGSTILPEALKTLLSTLPTGNQRQLKAILLIFEHGALLSHRRRFSSLSPNERARYVEGWMRSKIPQRRIIYRALRDLFGLLYYQHSDTWDAVGYAGPPSGLKS